MSRHKSTSNNLFKLVFGAVTLFTLGTAFVMFSEYFYGQQTSTLSKAATATTPSDRTNALEFRQVLEGSGDTAIVNPSNATLEKNGIRRSQSPTPVVQNNVYQEPRTKQPTPIHLTPFGTHSARNTFVIFDIPWNQFDTGIVKSYTIQFAKSPTFTSGSILKTITVDLSKNNPDWKHEWINDGYYESKPGTVLFPSGIDIYWRVRLNGFSTIISGQPFTVKNGDWAVAAQKYVPYAYAPNPISPINKSSIDLKNPTLVWKRADDDLKNRDLVEVCVQYDAVQDFNCRAYLYVNYRDMLRTVTFPLPASVLSSGRSSDIRYWNVCDYKNFIYPDSPNEYWGAAECSPFNSFSTAYAGPIR